MKKSSKNSQINWPSQSIVGIGSILFSPKIRTITCMIHLVRFDPIFMKTYNKTKPTWTGYFRFQLSFKFAWKSWCHIYKILTKIYKNLTEFYNINLYHICTHKHKMERKKKRELENKAIKKEREKNIKWRKKEQRKRGRKKRGKKE